MILWSFFFAVAVGDLAHRQLIRASPRGTPRGKLIVVANCNEDYTSWRTDVDIPILVYEKCHEQEDPQPPFLVNTGEECIAYLTFITQHYDALPDQTFFLQAYPTKHSPYINFILKHLHEQLDFASLSNLYIGYNASGFPNAPLGTLLQTWVPKWFGVPQAKVAGSYCCGLFVASRRAIRARPLSFWHSLLAMSNGSIPTYVPGDWRRRHEAGLFERIWHLAFGEEQLQRPYLKFVRHWHMIGMHGYKWHLHQCMTHETPPSEWITQPIDEDPPEVCLSIGS